MACREVFKPEAVDPAPESRIPARDVRNQRAADAALQKMPGGQPSRKFVPRQNFLLVIVQNMRVEPDVGNVTERLLQFRRLMTAQQKT